MCGRVREGTRRTVEKFRVFCFKSDTISWICPAFRFRTTFVVVSNRGTIEYYSFSQFVENEWLYDIRFALKWPTERNRAWTLNGSAGSRDSLSCTGNVNCSRGTRIGTKPLGLLVLYQSENSRLLQVLWNNFLRAHFFFYTNNIIVGTTDVRMNLQTIFVKVTHKNRRVYIFFFFYELR